MPLDRKDSGSTWQGPQSYKITEVPPDEPWEPSDEEPTPTNSAEQLYTEPNDTSGLHLNADYQDEVETQPTSARSQVISQFGYYASFILIPLLFALLTGLIVLPVVATGHAKLPPQTIIPLAVILVVIALAQGIAIYYAGTTNGIWAIYTIIGFFLFITIGCFALFGPFAGIVTLILLIGLSLFLARQYVRSIPEGFVDIVRSFGRYSRTLYPGFNVLLPWETVSDHLHTTETVWQTPVQRVQMTRDEDVLLRGTITYQLQPEDAHLAVTNVQNWETSLHNLFITALQTVAATFTPEDFIAWPQGMHTRPTHGSVMPLAEGEPRWEQVNGLVFQRIRDRVALWGVLINEVRLHDIILASHEVAASMHDTTAPMAHPQAQQPSVPKAQQSSTSKATSKQTAPQQAVKQTVPQPPPVPAAPIPKGLKEETLRQAYLAVKNGSIKEPETIRNLAAQFDTVARTPELNDAFTFDAARAAANLYAEADRREEEIDANAGTLFTDETKPDWAIRRPTDENLMAGG
jgi:regulator of protease activity HflC (stomatin/prohibitin superfamily)